MQGKCTGKLPLRMAVSLLEESAARPVTLAGWAGAHGQGCWLLAAAAWEQWESALDPGRKFPFSYSVIFEFFINTVPAGEMFYRALLRNHKGRQEGLMMRCKKLTSGQSTTHVVCFISQRIILNSAASYLVFSRAKKVKTFFSKVIAKKYTCYLW